MTAHPIFSLSYISTATETIDADALSDILKTAQRRNGEADVTGVLIFNGLNFLQVLEGNEAAVRTIYASILRDDRHTGVRLVSEGTQATRVFPQWSMYAAVLANMRTSHLTDFPAASADLVIPTGAGEDLKTILSNFLTLKG